ncbi:MAG: FIST N-terminal domain-containing protein, partial [Pseudobdellovibrionaceae bacterium]
MKIQNFFYKNSKWSSPMDGSLDSENTMVLCFYDPEKNWQDQFLDLKNKYPQSKIIGCSSAGEIFETQVFDHSISVAVSCFEKTQLKQVQVDISSAENSFALGVQMGQ